MTASRTNANSAYAEYKMRFPMSPYLGTHRMMKCGGSCP